MNIPELIKEAHKNAVERGDYDCPQCEDGNHVDDTDSENVILTKCEDCNGTGIDPNINIADMLMDIITELCKALEAHKQGRFADWDEYQKHLDYYNTRDKKSVEYISKIPIAFRRNIKDTREDKIADVFIRLFDLCGYLGIEISKIEASFDRYIACGFVDINTGEFMFRIIKEYIVELDNPNIDFLVGKLLARLFLFCKYHNIPIEKHIKAKMAYNRTRPHKHGKEY